MKNSDTKPWYKHFWPWFVIFFPALSIVAGLTTVMIAVNNQDNLVNDDYYKEGLAINKVLVRDKHARELGISSTILINHDKGMVRVILQGITEENMPDVLHLSFSHPTRKAMDVQWILNKEQGGIYSGSTGELATGSWHVQVGPEDEQWRLTGRISLPKEVSVMLKPS